MAGPGAEPGPEPGAGAGPGAEPGPYRATRLVSTERGRAGPGGAAACRERGAHGTRASAAGREAAVPPGLLSRQSGAWGCAVPAAATSGCPGTLLSAVVTVLGDTPHSLSRHVGTVRFPAPCHDMWFPEPSCPVPVFSGCRCSGTPCPLSPHGGAVGRPALCRDMGCSGTSCVMTHGCPGTTPLSVATWLLRDTP